MAGIKREDVFSTAQPKPVEDPGYLETGLKSYVRGSAGLVSGAGSAAEWAGDVTGYRGLRELGQTLQEAGEVAAESPMGRLEGPSFEGTFIENPSLKRAFGIGVEAVPSLAAAVAGGGGTSALLSRAGLGAKAASRIGSGIAAGGLGLVEGAPQYTEAREAGKGVGTASAIGAAATVGSAALEFLGLGKIFGLAGKGVAKGAGTGIITEGLQEGTQQLWQNVVAKVGYDKGRSLVDGMVESIIGGAGAGGFVGGVTGAVQTKTDNVQAQALSGLFPGADVSVNEGVAFVANPSTGQQMSAKVEDVAQALASGVQQDELFAAFQEIKTGVDAVSRREVAPAEAPAEVSIEPPRIIPEEGVTPQEVAVPEAEVARVAPAEAVTPEVAAPEAPERVTLYKSEALDEGVRVTDKAAAGEGAVSEERMFAKVLDFGETPALEDATLYDSVDFAAIEEAIGAEGGALGAALEGSDSTLDKFIARKGEARLPILMRSPAVKQFLVEQGYDAVKTKEDTQASGDYKDAYFVLREEAQAPEVAAAPDTVAPETETAPGAEVTPEAEAPEVETPEVGEASPQFVTQPPPTSTFATRQAEVERGTAELQATRTRLTESRDLIQRQMDAGVLDRDAGERELAQNKVLLDAAELALRDRPGVQAFAEDVRETPAVVQDPWKPRYKSVTAEPTQAYDAVGGYQKAGVAKVKAAVKQMANPKSKLHDLYVQHAPKWLSVSPLHTLTQAFGESTPQIKLFADNLATLEAAQNQLVDNAVVQYEKVERLTRGGNRLDLFNRAAATASFNQMTPWESARNQDWVPEVSPAAKQLSDAQREWVAAGMQKATGLTFKEAHTEAKQAYNRLPESLQREYRNTVKMLSDLRQRERDNLLAYIEEMTEEGSSERDNLMMHFDATFNNLRGAYWPLQRNGDFILSYTDASGFRQVSHFDSVTERSEVKNRLAEQGVDPGTVVESFKDKQPRGAVGAPQVLLDQITSVVRNKYMENVDPSDDVAVGNAMESAQDVINSMTQAWMRWQPETAALKNSIRRKSVKGFSSDMLRSFLDYTQRHATNIAWAEHGRQVDRAVQDLADQTKSLEAEGGVNTDMQRMLTNELRNRVHALRNTRIGPVASALGKLSTGYYMTSPSIALVQMSQLGVLTYPKLAVKYGISKATKALAGGVKGSVSPQFTRETMFGDEGVNQVYENMYSRVGELTRDLPRAREKNIGDRLYSEDEIQRQFDGLDAQQKKLFTLRVAMDRNLLDISAAHEAYDLAKGKDPDAWSKKVMDIAMLPMSLSELASRKASILATYELAQSEGKSFTETMNDISEVVNDTLYSYAKSNKPALMQGGVARNVLQFQWYRIMTGLRMAMLFKNSMKSFVEGGIPAGVKSQATKEFVGIMGMTGLLSGTMGLPMAQATFALLDLVLGDEDEPVDSKLMFTNWLRENLGEAAGEAVTTGAPSLLGTDLSRRIGLGDIYGFQNDPPPGLHGKNLAAWWAASQLGPVFSVGQSWMQGYDEIMNKGNYMKGLEVATPKPIRDALKALRVGTEGVKTGAGKKIVPDEDIGPDEIIMIALGFNPDEISKAQRAESSLRGLTTRISERRGELIRRAARAMAEQGDMEEVLADIRAFNRRMPRYAVSGRDIRPAVRKILRGEFGATGRRETTVAEQFEVPVYRR